MPVGYNSKSSEVIDLLCLWLQLDMLMADQCWCRINFVFLLARNDHAAPSHHKHVGDACSHSLFPQASLVLHVRVHVKHVSWNNGYLFAVNTVNRIRDCYGDIV